jgi:hypothetical protein
MSLFTDEEKRDIREYVFQLDESVRFKILQSVSIMESEDAEEDTLVSLMYYMAKNPKQVNRIHQSIINSGAVVGSADEGEPDENSKEG